MGGPWKPDLAAEAQRRWRAKNPDRVRELHAAAYAATRALLDELKDVPCMDCGRTFPPECVDFDHRPGETKRFSLNHSGGRTSGAIMAEVAKCDIVCANCHRTRTRSRRVVTGSVL
jgi:hypothetical protein